MRGRRNYEVLVGKNTRCVGVEGSFRFKLRFCMPLFTGYTTVDERRGLLHEWSGDTLLAQTLYVYIPNAIFSHVPRIQMR